MTFLAFLIRMLLFALLARLVVSALRVLGLGRRQRAQRSSATARQQDEKKRILGDDIVDADFEDVSKDPGR